jgi:hypothetical protein
MRIAIHVAVVAFAQPFILNNLILVAKTKLSRIDCPLKIRAKYDIELFVGGLLTELFSLRPSCFR